MEEAQPQNTRLPHRLPPAVLFFEGVTIDGNQNCFGVRSCIDFGCRLRRRWTGNEPVVSGGKKWPADSDHFADGDAAECQSRIERYAYMVCNECYLGDHR